MTGGVLLLLMLLVSWSSLLLQSMAMIHVQRCPASYEAERIARHGHLRTAVCRVIAAAVYASAALFQITGGRIPGAGTLGPEALVIFVAVQFLWWYNAGADVSDGRKLRQLEGHADDQQRA